MLNPCLQLTMQLVLHRLHSGHAVFLLFLILGLVIGLA